MWLSARIVVCVFAVVVTLFPAFGYAQTTVCGDRACPPLGPVGKNLGGPVAPGPQQQASNPVVPGCGCYETNPINAATGNKFQIENDFTAGPHTGLALTRYYNSQGTTSSAFGKAWHSTWHNGLTVSDNVVTVTRADGREDTFTNNGSGIYTADPDVTSTFTAITSAGGTITGWKLTLADDTIETYLIGGQLSSVTSRAGLVTTLTYDGRNNLFKVTGPFGHTLTFANDSSGRVSQMTVPDGGTYTYAYSSSGNLASVTYPSGAQRQYFYENTTYPNALTGIIDENGQRFATYAYDTQGRAVSSQHAGGVELTTLTYNSDGTTSVTDARGNVHSYGLSTQFSLVKPTGVTGAPVQTAGGQAFTYDSNGFIASNTDWNGNATTYTHDAQGNETSRIMAFGTPQARTITTTWDPTFNLPTQVSDVNRILSFTYDAKGNLLTGTLTAPGTSSTWSYTYNSAGQVLTATDPLGHVTRYAYGAKGDLGGITNALGQVTRFSSYDANGRPLKIQDPNGLVTTLTYNFRGDVTSKTEAQWVTTYVYDAVGQLIKLTRPDHSFLTFTYDTAHRLTGVADSLGNRTAYTLDLTSNRTLEQVFGATGNLVRKRSYTYDAVNRLSQLIGALGQTTSYSRDTNGNLTQIADPLGHATSATYDPLNRLIGTTDPNGGMTGFTYDPLSRLAGVTDPRGLVTSYAYDGLNDLTSLVSPDNGVTTKTYDAAGNVLTSTDARGKTTAYSYDALNRVTKAAFADGTAIVYQYDQGANGIGRLTSMSDPGGTTTWAYNVHGQVTSKQQTSGRLTLTTSRAYNAATGQLASTTYPSGSAIFYSYDANGRVSAVNHQPPHGARSLLLSKIAYQPFGPAASWLQGNGASYRRTFDQDGRVAGLAFPPSNAIALTYDAASRITGIAETGLPAKSFGYDALNRVVNYTSGTTAQTYGYDTSGNRTAFTNQSPSSNVTLTYNYDNASNRLLSIGGHWSTGYTYTENFTYDVNGNTLSHTSPFADYTYTYNARNRRTQAYAGAYTTTDLINGLGQRTAQTLISADEFIYDETGHLIGSYDSNGRVLDETVWLDDLPVAVLSGGQPSYIAPDHLGAPHQITNAGGHVEWQWDHDPFGNSQPTGTFSYGLRFPGQVYDQRSKLHYNYFRDYDPSTGRYIESDPVGLAGGINTYAFVAGNPLSFVDPLGLDLTTAQQTAVQTSAQDWSASKYCPGSSIYARAPAGNTPPLLQQLELMDPKLGLRLIVPPNGVFQQWDGRRTPDMNAEQLQCARGLCPPPGFLEALALDLPVFDRNGNVDTGIGGGLQPGGPPVRGTGTSIIPGGGFNSLGNARIGWR
jgi:RHS repeat-associated protein